MTNSSTHRVTAVIALVLAASTGVAHAQRGRGAAPNFDAFYELGPDSLVRRGVPKGTVKGPVTLPSQVYPGVAHDYWVYVPAQYDGKTEVSLMMFNDGATYVQPDGYYRAVNVLDNLIYRGELPVMIAAFIDPGKFIKDGASNRQAEYDPPDARYSRVIVERVMTDNGSCYRSKAFAKACKRLSIRHIAALGSRSRVSRGPLESPRQTTQIISTLRKRVLIANPAQIYPFRTPECGR
jgi:hypothetical protein